MWRGKAVPAAAKRRRLPPLSMHPPLHRRCKFVRRRCALVRRARTLVRISHPVFLPIKILKIRDIAPKTQKLGKNAPPPPDFDEKHRRPGPPNRPDRRPNGRLDLGYTLLRNVFIMIKANQAA